jgi:thiosulfate reductase cytochrome b subunit
MKTLKKKHPLAIRWFHWINFPVLFLMIWSGLLIYSSNAVYRIGLGYTLLTFFPERFFQALGIPYHSAKGMSPHFFFMWFFVINGVLYIAYGFISGEWRYLVPNRHSFREAIRVALHDLHLSKIEPAPRKFNGAQQIAYTTAIPAEAAGRSDLLPLWAGQSANLSTCTDVLAFLASLGEKVSEIAGPLIQWSAASREK